MTSNTPPQLGNHGSPNTVLPDPTTENEGFRAYKAGLAAGCAEGAAAERRRLWRVIEPLAAIVILPEAMGRSQAPGIDAVPLAALRKLLLEDAP